MMSIGAFAPPFRLVGGYFAVGVMFLVICVFTFWNADFDIMLSLNSALFFHTFLLGFVISIIIGALYQLVSVILEKPFFTLKFAYLNFFVFTIGVISLLLGMYFENLIFLNIAGILLMIFFLYFCTVYLLSFIGCKVWNFSVISLLCSGIFLLFGILCALALVLVLNGRLDIDFSFLVSLHIYLVFGSVYFVILGASSVLIPMFSLAHKSKFYLYYLSGISYVLGFFALFYEIKFSEILAIISVILFVLQVIMILQKRIRKKFEYWSLNIYFSFICLILGVIYFYFGESEKLIFTLSFGFLYSFIVAHLYKILPFLIWYNYISKFVGKLKIPMLDDMIMKKVAYMSLAFNVLAIFFSGFGFRLSALILIFISIVLLITNIINFFRYTKFGQLKKGK